MINRHREATKVDFLWISGYSTIGRPHDIEICQSVIQYAWILVRLYKWTSDQASDVLSIIFFFIISQTLYSYFCKITKKINWNDFCKEICKKLWKKISLGTSDAWLLVHLYKRTSIQAYYIIDWRILGMICICPNQLLPFLMLETFFCQKSSWKIIWTKYHLSSKPGFWWKIIYQRNLG